MDAASATVSEIYDFGSTAVGMYFGNKESWVRGTAATDRLTNSISQATVGGVTKAVFDGTYEYSPVGVVGAMADDRYDLAGSRGAGVVLGLATGAATHGVANILGDVLGGTGVYGKCQFSRKEMHLLQLDLKTILSLKYTLISTVMRSTQIQLMNIWIWARRPELWSGI